MEVKKIQDHFSQAALENFDPYAEVELTEQEKNEALFLAKQRKHAALNSIAYKAKILADKEYRTYSAEDLYTKASKRFVLDEFNKRIIWALCLYFVEDKRSNLDFEKGIYLYGPIGCGKTEIMKFFRQNQTKSYAVFDVRDIAGEFTKHGHDEILRYKNLIKTSDHDANFGQKEIGTCFDDIGTEVDKKHYGNESNVMADIILTRYTNKEIYHKTHFTANMNAEGIGERYGLRVRSRLAEMVQIIEFSDQSPDRRKKG